MLDLQKLRPVLPILLVGVIANDLIGIGTLIAASYYQLREQTLALVIVFATSAISSGFLGLVNYYQHRLGSEKKHGPSITLLVGGFETSLSLTFLALHIVNVIGSNDWFVNDPIMLMYAAFCALVAG